MCLYIYLFWCVLLYLDIWLAISWFDLQQPIASYSNKLVPGPGERLVAVHIHPHWLRLITPRARAPPVEENVERSATRFRAVGFQQLLDLPKTKLAKSCWSANVSADLKSLQILKRTAQWHSLAALAKLHHVISQLYFNIHSKRNQVLELVAHAVGLTMTIGPWRPYTVMACHGHGGHWIHSKY